MQIFKKGVKKIAILKKLCYNSNAKKFTPVC